MNDLQKLADDIGLNLTVPDGLSRADASEDEIQRLQLLTLEGVLGAGNTATAEGAPHFVSLGASASGNIPAHARSWSFIVLTGTGTLAGVSVPLSLPLSGGPLAANLAYTTGATSTGFLFYETA